MIPFHLPNLRKVFGWLFLIMILSFGIGGVLLVLEPDAPNPAHEGNFEFSIPAQEIERARINMAIDAGNIRITGETMEDLLTGDVHVETKHYLPRLTHTITNKTMNIAIDRPSDIFHEIIGGEENWNVSVHNKTPLSLLLSVGSGDIHMQPGNAQISELALELGAGSLYLDIHEWKGDSLPIRIENGAGDITVLFPERSRVSVALDRAIGNVFLAGFTGDANGYYHETHSPDAPNIHVSISQGIGDVTLRTVE
ncbi:toast rack family protein [Methanospirillum hungatei]|uniref:toast rack family protein n=1 Tax=Methanospirillum hungatei TaxID=2203 RepID=UPI0026EEB6A6|nr:toast rack family protein [Methanospirillum hungatei]MCA1917321.1 toast rack family protein [Methanospirillum hungatei]